MRAMRVGILLFVFVSCLATGCGRGDEILEFVPTLQRTARASTSGSLGCGVGSVTLVTSRGEVKASCGLDPIHVFGKKIHVADIHTLLRSRADSNRTEWPGPMSGDVGELCYVCLLSLSLANDPESIAVIAPLLEDKEDVVRGWAAIALYRIAKADGSLRKEIEKIEFPDEAVASARARGNPPPSWVVVRK